MRITISSIRENIFHTKYIKMFNHGLRRVKSTWKEFSLIIFKFNIKYPGSSHVKFDLFELLNLTNQFINGDFYRIDSYVYARTYNVLCEYTFRFEIDSDSFLSCNNTLVRRLKARSETVNQSYLQVKTHLITIW